MKPYQLARKIYYGLKIGETIKVKQFPQVQQSLNVVKRRHKDKAKMFKSNKKEHTITRLNDRTPIPV